VSGYTAPYAAWHAPVFLLNSRLGRFTAARSRSEGKPPHGTGHPFFRSYGISMPSSLTTFHSFTCGYSPHPPVSVYCTDILQLPIKLFLPADSTSLGSAEASPRHQFSVRRPTTL